MILERDDCTLTLTVGDRIEYVLDAGDRRIVIGTALDGIDTLTRFLEQSVEGGRADVSRLLAASRAAAVRDDLGEYYPASIRAELHRWCHQAGLSSDWTSDGRRMHREHIAAMVPQPGTGRMVTISLGFWTPGEDDEFSIEEEYRAPDEVVGYSYGVRLPYDVLPQLTEYVENLAATTAPGDSDPATNLEDRLIAACGALVDPLAGPGALRDQVERWCQDAGIELRSGRWRGFDRREVLVQTQTRPDQLARVSFSIDAYSKRLGFQEGYGGAADSWHDALYQLEFGYDEAEKLLPWLKKRVGPVDQRLGPDDALVACWRALADRGELTPLHPMEVRDRVAGWLTEAGVTFSSHGSAWRETLLKVHRQPNDCSFTLSLTFDPSHGDEGITFTEFYDYGPMRNDPGREYGYSVHAPYDAVEVLADAYAPGTDGPAQERLAEAFRDLVAAGTLGDDLALEGNALLVQQGFEAAGVTATTSVWSWINSD